MRYSVWGNGCGQTRLIILASYSIWGWRCVIALPFANGVVHLDQSYWPPKFSSHVVILPNAGPSVQERAGCSGSPSAVARCEAM